MAVSQGVKYSFLVNILGGLIMGYMIGFLPIMLQNNQYLTNCGRYTTEGACHALTDANCQWRSSNSSENKNLALSLSSSIMVAEGTEKHEQGFFEDAITTTASSFPPSLTSNSFYYCSFPDHTNCSEFLLSKDCKGVAQCYWRYHKNECAHQVGWDANQQGILAGAQIIGAMISSPFAGPLTNKYGRRWSVMMCGLCALLATLFFTVGWSQSQSYAMLVIAETLVGMVGGWVSVVCPMYCGEMAGAALAEVIGMFFQVAITFGIMSAAIVGLILDPRNDTSDPNAHLQGRFQINIGIQWFISFLLLPMGYAMPESILWLQEKHPEDYMETEHSPCIDNNEIGGGAKGFQQLQKSTSSESPQESSGVALPAVEQPSVSLCRRDLLIPLLVGIALGVAQQLTGINAIMIYAPELVGSIGVQPLLGNFLIMLWNFLTCLLSIPLVRKYPPRMLYLVSTAIAAVTCFTTGIAVFPGVLPDGSAAQQILGWGGILGFICAFECGIGPCFYVLAQDTFPPDVRSAGCSYTVWVQFVFNAIVNWGFPVAMTGFSGGPSGDQNKGMAICFFMFSGFGAATATFIHFKMPKSNAEKKRESLAEGGIHSEALDERMLC